MPTSNTRKKVAVIGSGFGGLSAAIRLQATGYDVTIFEKRDKPGGRGYVFEDQGFKFDAGPTVITDPACIRELWDLAGEKIEDDIRFVKLSPFYRLFWEDGWHFDYSDNEEDTKRQILAKCPDDYEGYKKFLKYSEELCQEGYVKLGAVPFLDFWSMIKVAPQLVRLQAQSSVFNRVASFVKDPQLREAFSFHTLLVGGSPFRASAIYALIHYLERHWGVWFPMGGTSALVQAMVRLFKRKGGKLVLSAETDEILTDGQNVKGLRLKNGEVHDFDLVVSNADIHHTYKTLLRKEPATDGMKKKLDKMSYSMSLFLIYFGTNKKWDNIAHHNVIFGPRYKGLIEDIFQNGVLPEDFSLYLHNPTQTDPSLAPTGCQAFYVLSPVSHLGKLDIDWASEGPKYANKILDYLEKKYMPGLRSSVVTQRIFTPADFRSELNSHVGSAFSVEPTLLQSAYFRPHNLDHNIEGLYFVGAGTHPGAGLPGVIGSAKATAGLIHQKFGRTTVGERADWAAASLRTETGAREHDRGASAQN